MSKQVIGPREQQLRDMRVNRLSPGNAAAGPGRRFVAALPTLPVTSGKKPMKRKAKRKAK
jgi:hypothetical protein